MCHDDGVNLRFGETLAPLPPGGYASVDDFGLVGATQTLESAEKLSL